MKLLITILLVSASCTLVQGQNNVSLLENSPFMPPGKANGADANAEKGPASLAKLQLRGITSIDGEYIFSVYNPDTRESKWLSPGVAEDGLVIKSYDPDANSVVIHSESENLSRQMEMNDYAASVGMRAATFAGVTTQPTQPQRPSAIPAQSPTGTSTISRTQQSVERPTRRNLETLRARREELAEKLRKQPGSSSPEQAKPQPNGAKR